MRIIVVGGGVLGASTAFHLAREGAEVVLVERGHDGRATSAGAGIVSPWTSQVVDPAWYALARAAGRYYPTLVEMLADDGEADIGYRCVGSIVVPPDSDALQRAETLIRTRALAAPEAGVISRLTPAEARSLFPPLRPDLAAVHIAGAARVDGRMLAAALTRAAQRHGATLLTGTAELLTGESRVTGIKLDGETMQADLVVVTGGAWAPALLAPLGVALPVAPQRGQIVHLRLPGVDTRKFPVVQPLNEHYMLAFDDNRVVVGATRETGVGFDYRMTAGGIAEVLNRALEIAPGLASATIHEIRIGFRPMSADNRALLGGVPKVAGLIIGNGLGSSGLTHGPYAGRLLAQLALGQVPELDLATYSPVRG